MLETLDHTIRIGSTPTVLYFDLYLHSAGLSWVAARVPGYLPARAGFFREKTRVPGFLGEKTGFLPKIVFFFYVCNFFLIVYL